MGGGRLQKLTQGASILGLLSWAHWYRNGQVLISIRTFRYKTKWRRSGDHRTSVLNDLLPGLAALGLTFLCMYLLRKKVNAMYIIFALFGVGILGYHLVC